MEPVFCSKRLSGWVKFLPGVHQIDRLEFKRMSKILYCQCSFSDANSIRTYNKDKKVAFKEVLSQFKIAKPNLSDDEINSYIRRYKKKGEFLQADTLILLQHMVDDFRILCVDLSVFTPPLDFGKPSIISTK